MALHPPSFVTWIDLVDEAISNDPAGRQLIDPAIDRPPPTT